MPVPSCKAGHGVMFPGGRAPFVGDRSSSGSPMRAGTWCGAVAGLQLGQLQVGRFRGVASSAKGKMRSRCSVSAPAVPRR
jgi:hypothetical protein